MSNPFTYTFYIDGEILDLKHADYLENEDLVTIVRDTARIRLFLGRTIMSFSEAFMKSKPALAKEVRVLAQMFEANPLQFYAPNSQEQLDFINCTDGTVIANIDPNRCGKTTAAWIRMLTQDPPMVKCDPKWPIFTEHGVNYHEFKGPISCGICTYNTAKLGDPIWKEVVKKWTPDSELGLYGRTYRGKGAKYEPSWGHDKITKFQKSESLLGYYTYESDQGNFEGGALHKWLWDEQGREAQWDGADRGTRTTGGEHIHSVTPHKVAGRPDTGASSWMYPMFTGKRNKGHVVRTFTGTRITDVPDWIYPQASKEIEIAKWETEPKKNNNRKDIAEGRARLYGEWHRTAGLVLDEWTPELSVIEPLWEHPPLDEFSVYRSMDHGYKHPFCSLWWAVHRSGDIIIFRELYTTGRTVHANVAEMVRLSGNSLKYLDIYDNETSNMSIKRYEEQYDTEPVVRQVLDSRSFALVSDAVGRPRGWLYRAAGLRGIAQAAGKFYDHWVPLANELLKPDFSRKHMITGEEGAPRIYVFSCCVNFIREIEAWAWKEGRGEQVTAREVPTEGDNDAMTAFGYGIQMRLRYVPNMMQVNGADNQERDGEEGVVKKRGRRQGVGAVGGYRRV